MARPTKYREEYNDLLIQHMEKGFCFSTFACSIRVSRKTLYNWEKRFPDFREAFEIGEAKALAYYEQIGIKGMLGKIKHFNVRLYRLTMMNRFGWR